MSGNVFEAEARQRKTLRLVMALDVALAELRIDPFSVAAGTVIVSMNEAAWEQAARSAGVPLPSETTRRDVRRTYADRFALRLMAAAGTP